MHANSRVSYDHFNMLNMAVLRVIGQKRKLHVPSKISKPDLIDMLLKDKTKYGELTNKHLETMNALLPEAKARKRKRENLINGLHKHSEVSIYQLDDPSIKLPCACTVCQPETSGWRQRASTLS